MGNAQLGKREACHLDSRFHNTYAQPDILSWARVSYKADLELKSDQNNIHHHPSLQ